jgi:coniferyl-aldehyde dehydrogenase
MSLETVPSTPKAAPPHTKKGEATAEAAPSMAEALGRMKAAQRKQGAPSFEVRMRRLDALESALKRRAEDIVRACAADYGQRSRHVTLVSEVVFCLEEIRYVRSRLAEWMETEVRDVPLTLMPARCEVVMQPVGVVGIIVPWNYPVQLAFAPLVGALAAGNRAMLKMPELTPHTSELVKQIVADCFDPDVATVFTGDVAAGTEFSGLPFDHLVFTGSPRIGKVVMKAAAEHLVPVTLELGGKSPAIVGESFSLDQAAERILWAKTWNGGQTCIAPDYVLVPRSKLDAFVAACKKAFSVAYRRSKATTTSPPSSATGTTRASRRTSTRPPRRALAW